MLQTTSPNTPLGDNCSHTNACPKPVPAPWSWSPEKMKVQWMFPHTDALAYTHKKPLEVDKNWVFCLRTLTECTCKETVFSPPQEGNFYSCSDIPCIEIGGCFILKNYLMWTIQLQLLFFLKSSSAPLHKTVKASTWTDFFYTEENKVLASIFQSSSLVQLRKKDAF